MSPRIANTIEKVNSWYKTAAVTIACGLLIWYVGKMDSNNTTIIETHQDTREIKSQLSEIKKDQEAMKEKIAILWASRARGFNQGDIKLRDGQIDL